MVGVSVTGLAKRHKHMDIETQTRKGGSERDGPFREEETQKQRTSETWRHRHTSPERVAVSVMGLAKRKRHRDTETQKHRDTETQNKYNTKAQTHLQQRMGGSVTRLEERKRHRNVKHTDIPPREGGSERDGPCRDGVSAGELYMCVCMYVYIYIYTYVCIYIYMCVYM